MSAPIAQSPLCPGSLLVYAITVYCVIRFGLGTSVLRKGQTKPTGWSALKDILPLEILTSRTFRTDAAHFFINNLALALFAVFMVSVTVGGYVDWSLPHFTDWLTKTWGPPAIPATNGLLIDLAYTLSVLLAYDVGKYVLHVLFHRVPVLWEFHKVHHSAPQLSLLSFFREHFIEIALGNSLAGILIGLVVASFKYGLNRAPSEVTIGGVAIIGVLMSISWLLQHSHVWWSFGRLETILYSPAMHIIHHSKDPRHFNKNYGSSLSFCDLLCGTLYRTSRLPPENLQLGIDDDFDWESASLGAYLIRPFTQIYKTLRRSPPSDKTSPRENNRDAA